MCKLFSCGKKSRTSPSQGAFNSFVDNKELPRVKRRTQNATQYIKEMEILKSKETKLNKHPPSDLEQILKFGYQTATMLDQANKLTLGSIRSLDYSKEIDNLSFKDFGDISGDKAKEKLKEYLKGRSALGSYIWIFSFALRFVEKMFSPYNEMLFKEETQELFDEFICLVKRIFDMTIFVAEFIVEEKAKFHKTLKKVHFPSEFILNESTEESLRKKRIAYQWKYPVDTRSSTQIRKCRILTASKGFRGRAYLQDLGHERDIENMFREISLKIYEGLWDNLGYGLSLLRLCRGKDSNSSRDGEHIVAGAKPNNAAGKKRRKSSTKKPSSTNANSSNKHGSKKTKDVHGDEYEELHLPHIAKISEGLRILERYILHSKQLNSTTLPATPTESEQLNRNIEEAKKRNHESKSNPPSSANSNPLSQQEDELINEVIKIILDRLDLLERSLFQLRLIVQEARHTMHYCYEMVRKKHKWNKGSFENYYVDKNFNITHGKNWNLVSCPPFKFRFGRSVLEWKHNNLDIHEQPLSWQEATHEFNSSFYIKILKILPVKAGDLFLFVREYEPIFEKNSVNLLIKEKELKEMKKRQKIQTQIQNGKTQDSDSTDSDELSSDSDEEAEAPTTTTAADKNTQSTSTATKAKG